MNINDFNNINMLIIFNLQIFKTFTIKNLK